MNQSTRLKNAETRLRQLACLNTDGMVNAPSLFRELHVTLGFAHGCIWNSNVQLEGSIYLENPDAMARLPMLRDTFFERDGERLWRPSMDVYFNERGPTPLSQSLKVSRRDFYKSDFYNLCWGPSAQHDFVRMQLRNNGQWLGMFGVYRQAGDRDFNDEDMHMIGRLEPFLAHAMTPRASADVQSVDAETGMLVVDRRGVLRWLSPVAKSLLSMALGCVPKVLPAELLRAIGELSRINAGEHDARLPVWRCRSAFGRFTFTAHWLHADEPGDSMIGITLTRHIPLSLRLFDAMHKHPMPRRQSEVCLLVALGRSNEQIAAELGIGISSVITHRRAIYHRLEVQSREQLVSKLLGEGETA